MNDTNNNNDVTEIEAVGKVQRIGQVLQAARLAQVMSIQDIARQLRLSERQIAAIEEDDYSIFPSRTFLRGFIQNYAKLVREDTEDFSQLLRQSFPLVSSKTISYPVDGTLFTPNHKQTRGQLIIILMAILVSLLLIYEVYRSGGESQQIDGNVENEVMEEATIKSATEIEQAAEEIQLQLPPAISSEDPNNGVEVGQQKSDNLLSKPELTTEIVVTNKPAEEGGSVIRFMFTEESWVEVKDAGGNRIFSQINPRNTVKVVYGKPPFSLTIGNAANVKLVYNSNPVNLTPHIKNAGVARLSLN